MVAVATSSGFVWPRCSRRSAPWRWHSDRSGAPRRARLYLWDATYYAHIAAIGYPIHVATSPGGGLVRGGTLAFYPLFPELARLVHLTGLSGVASCLLVAWAASAALGPAVGSPCSATTVGTTRTALIAVALLGALPMSITLQMAYAESTFVLLTVLALLAVQQRRWSAAGVLLLLAGLTRPVGLSPRSGLPGTRWRRRTRAAA